ncbi:hypothetical protein BS78_06G077300 [Paspalum vaginatum]|uniref:Uncharacterized protein n=1 Tax=Paspalum vaginatum TaxID=158149 RepID=A0A9W7X7M8_9POAL|nr:hypothetical protein BS78_K158000 [Paspalum vaginatum]KAJ1270772.1 hypothetical protein BS78_06G077300 [Paspalum vaginatum]
MQSLPFYDALDINQDNAGADGVDSAAPVAVVHDQPAAVLNVEGVDGKADAAAPDGDPLPDPSRADSSSTLANSATVLLSTTNEYTVRTTDVAC